MAKKSAVDNTDALLKALFCLCRSVDEVLDAQAIESAGGDHGLSSSKVRLMKLIAHNGEQMIGQIARFLGVSDPAASQLSDALEHQRLVARRVNPRDRRSAFVRLTPQGKRAITAVEKEQRKRLSGALKAAGRGSMKDWVTQLESLARALGQADDTYEEFCLQCVAFPDGTCLLGEAPDACSYRRHEERLSRAMQVRKPAAGRGRPTRKVRRTPRARVRRRSRAR